MPVGEIVKFTEITDPMEGTVSKTAEIVFGDQASFQASTVFYIMVRGGIPSSVTKANVQTYIDNNITDLYAEAQASGRLVTYEPEVMIKRLYAVRSILGKVADELYIGGLGNQTQGDATLAAALTELAANSTLHNRFNAWRLYMNIGVSTVPGLLTAANVGTLTAADRRAALRELKTITSFWISVADAVTLLESV